MLHYSTPNIKNLNKKLLLDCRRNIFKSIKNNIPLNECPSFYYCPKGEIVYVFSKQEQGELTKIMNETLSWGGDFDCCLCLKMKSGYGFVLISITNGSLNAYYQKIPFIEKDEYVFPKHVKIENPFLSLNFLFNQDEYVVYH